VGSVQNFKVVPVAVGSSEQNGCLLAAMCRMKKLLVAKLT